MGEVMKEAGVGEKRVEYGTEGAGSGTSASSVPGASAEMDTPRKLNTRDLIIAGAFAAVYIVVLLAVVTVSGFVPILYLMAPLFLGIVLGPIFSVYCTKLNKPGALLVLAILVGLAESMTGNWIGLGWAILAGGAGELLARAGRYHSKRSYLAAYSVFSLTNMGPFWLLILAKARFLEACAMYFGSEYVATIDALTPPWIVLALIALALVGGLIGGVLGQRLLRKHFERAGVV
jgi:energy-coupling factor transport system substrate-specific component